MNIILLSLSILSANAFCIPTHIAPGFENYSRNLAPNPICVAPIDNCLHKSSYKSGAQICATAAPETDSDGTVQRLYSRGLIFQDFLPERFPQRIIIELPSHCSDFVSLYAFWCLREYGIERLRTTDVVETDEDSPNELLLREDSPRHQRCDSIRESNGGLFEGSRPFWDVGINFHSHVICNEKIGNPCNTNIEKDQVFVQNYYFAYCVVNGGTVVDLASAINSKGKKAGSLKRSIGSSGPQEWLLGQDVICAPEHKRDNAGQRIEDFLTYSITRFGEFIRHGDALFMKRDDYCYVRIPIDDPRGPFGQGSE
jgi:hypothetical protein